MFNIEGEERVGKWDREREGRERGERGEREGEKKIKRERGREKIKRERGREKEGEIMLADPHVAVHVHTC